MRLYLLWHQIETLRKILHQHDQFCQQLTNHQNRFNGACPQTYKCLELCLEHVDLEFHKLSLYLVFCFAAVKKNNLESAAKCALQVFIWAEMASETAATYGPSLSCPPNRPMTCHSLGQLSHLKWLLIKGEFVLAEWRLSLCLYGLLLSRKLLTSVKTQHEEAGKMLFYKYRGIHINSHLDRTNKTCYIWGGRTRFLCTILSAKNGWLYAKKDKAQWIEW